MKIVRTEYLPVPSEDCSLFEREVQAQLGGELDYPRSRETKVGW